MRLVRVTLVVGSVLLLSLVGSPGGVTLADNAPGYVTPQGLAIGVPNTNVRMADEQVDLQVVERGDAAIAVVNATFDMANDGPAVQMLTGFPDTFMVNSGVDCCFLMFQPATISNFRAWSDADSYTPTEQTIAAGPYKGNQWFVWNMSYPAGKTLAVHVSYEQQLGVQSAYGYVTQHVPVFYVLQTGALWAGTIGHAHITFEAANGGAFVGAEGASSVASDHLEWDFSDFKPTSDVGSQYIFATPWKELRAAELAANQPEAGPNDWLRAAQDAVQLLGPAQNSYGPQKWLDDRYGAPLHDWATRANVLDSPDSWNTLGDADLYASGAMFRFGMRCWPQTAADDYQHAADLGSDAAAQSLSSLHAGGARGLPDGQTDAAQKPACGSDATADQSAPADQPATAAIPDTLTDGVRADVLAAVNRANSAWAAACKSLDPSALNGNVAGQELTSDLAELAKLRAQGQTRNNVNTAFNVTSVTLDSPGNATVRTRETWYAEISNASTGRLLQRTPAQSYSETYTLAYQNGGWIVTNNALQ
jgi:hypothetical protein